MKDKVVLITGANTGIGKAAALELARQGATVVITARNEAKAKAAQADIIEKTGNSRVSILLADFGDFAQVRQMAEEFKSRHDRLDVLINGDRVDALALIVHADDARSKGFALTKKMKELIPRQMFDVAIQNLFTSDTKWSLFWSVQMHDISKTH